MLFAVAKLPQHKNAHILPFLTEVRASTMSFWLTPHRWGISFSHFLWQFTSQSAKTSHLKICCNVKRPCTQVQKNDSQLFKIVLGENGKPKVQLHWITKRLRTLLDIYSFDTSRTTNTDLL